MRSTVLTLLLLAAPLAAQSPPAAPKLTVPAKVQAEVGKLATITPTESGPVVRYLDPTAVISFVPAELLVDKRLGVFTATRPGTFTVYCWTAAGDVPSVEAVTEVTVSGTVPVPPIPPGPTPTPPQPPIPVPTGGLRFLIVEESAKRPALPPAQLAVLFDKRVRDYMAAKSVEETLPDGSKWKSYRIYDQHTDTTADLPHWKVMMDRPRTSLPWLLIVGDGKPLFEGPLPPDVESTLAVMKKYGG